MKSDSGFSNSKISNGIPNFYNFFFENWILSVTIVPSGYIYPGNRSLQSSHSNAFQQ
jgi:hypothetical protein